jgi:hypothetical protein
VSWCKLEWSQSSGIRHQSTGSAQFWSSSLRESRIAAFSRRSCRRARTGEARGQRRNHHRAMDLAGTDWACLFRRSSSPAGTCRSLSPPEEDPDGAALEIEPPCPFRRSSWPPTSASSGPGQRRPDRVLAAAITKPGSLRSWSAGARGHDPNASR